MNPGPSSILLVGKPGHLRDALASLLGSLPSGSPIQCADTGLLAIKLIHDLHPSFVLVTTGLPEPETPELVQQIKQYWPRTVCLVMAEKSDLQRRAFTAGADCVLPGAIDFEQLLHTVENLMNRPNPA